MADQKDQGTDPPAGMSAQLIDLNRPPAENPACIPLNKRAMAGKLLLDINRAPESNSESDSDISTDGVLIRLSEEEPRKEKLQELQMKAFYSVLEAFALETSIMSNKRTRIIEKLMNEWEIADETHISIADKIQENLLTLQQMDTQILEETLLTKNARPRSTFVPKSRESWGTVNPESLIGKYVRIKLPDEDEFDDYIIKAYDAKEEMHSIETPAMKVEDQYVWIDLREDSDTMEVDDEYIWIDLRKIPPEDIIWEGGEKANFVAFDLNKPLSNVLLQSHSQQNLDKVTLPMLTHDVTLKIQELIQGDDSESIGSVQLTPAQKNEIYKEVAPRKKRRMYGVGSFHSQIERSTSGSFSSYRSQEYEKLKEVVESQSQLIATQQELLQETRSENQVILSVNQVIKFENQVIKSENKMFKDMFTHLPATTHDPVLQNLLQALNTCSSGTTSQPVGTSRPDDGAGNQQ